MKFSAITLLLVGALGFVLGKLNSDRQPLIALAQTSAAAGPANDGKLNIIIFGAHPDDAQYRGAGVAMKWAKLGYHVKLVSTTNGDIGHWQMAGGPLALRRKQEVLAVGQKRGVETEVLDIHEGEIMPTLENRRTITRLIHQWNANIVITNRPNDYHHDHRNTTILLQDTAYMVGVPFFTPDIPPLKRSAIYLYTSDRFQRPNPFRPDVAVAIDDVIDPALDALLLMPSQLQEGGADGHAGLYPEDESGRQRRTQEVRANLAKRYAAQADKSRDALAKFYGPERARSVRYAQAFEICEYGRQPSQDELKQMFPF